MKNRISKIEYIIKANKKLFQLHWILFYLSCLGIGMEIVVMYYVAMKTYPTTAMYLEQSLLALFGIPYLIFSLIALISLVLYRRQGYRMIMLLFILGAIGNFSANNFNIFNIIHIIINLAIALPIPFYLSKKVQQEERKNMNLSNYPKNV